MLDPLRTLPVVLPCLGRDAVVAAPDGAPALVEALRPLVGAVLTAPLAQLPPAGVDAALLLADELGAAGEHAEGLLAAADQALRAGGVLAVAVRGGVFARLTGAPAPGRTFSSDELRRALGHRGFEVELLAAPGAAGRLAGEGEVSAPREEDRLSGLLDAGPVLVGVGVAPAGGAARSRAFFASLPRKVLAAGVLCRDGAGRLLVVHDTFRGHWTIPGGVVDADEDPRTAAEREAWEEAGVRVRAGALLGVFAASWPDRLSLVYAAHAVDGEAPQPSPVHEHEVDAAAWWPQDEALRRLAPHIAEQVRRCLEAPGGTWRQ